MIRAIMELAGLVPAKPEPLDRIKAERFRQALFRPNRRPAFWK